jgi:hypothetical protein
VLAVHLAGGHATEPDDDFYVAANGSPDEVTFELPRLGNGARWLRSVATWEPPPRDLLPPGEEEPVKGDAVALPAHSCLLLRSGPG